MNDILFLVICIGAIFDVILFFKIWGMTNDVRELKKLYKYGSTEEPHIMKAVLMNDKESILDLVCDSFINEVRSCLPMNDEYFQKRVLEITRKHELYLKKYNIEAPDFSVYVDRNKIINPL